MGYSFRLTARVLLHALFHRQDSSYQGLCYTSRGALAGTRIAQWVHPTKDRFDDPSHHEQMLLPWSYISLLYGMNECLATPPAQQQKIGNVVNRMEIKNHICFSVYSQWNTGPTH